MKQILVLAVLFGFIMLPSGYAQGEPRFGIGPRIGFYKTEDAEDIYGFLGFQARLRFTEVFVGEFSIDWREDIYDLGYGDELVVTQYPVLLSAIFNVIPGSPVSPYFIVGAGWYNIRQSYDYGYETYEDDTQEFGYHLGGGMDFRFTPTMALNADVRYNALKIGQDDYDDEIDAGGWIFSTGFTFYL